MNTAALIQSDVSSQWRRCRQLRVRDDCMWSFPTQGTEEFQVLQIKKNNSPHFYVANGDNSWEDSQSLNVYNGLKLHFLTLKHASLCVKTLRGHVQKKILLNTGVMFLAQGGEKSVLPAAFARYVRKQLRWLCDYPRQNRQWIIVNHSCLLLLTCDTFETQAVLAADCRQFKLWYDHKHARKMSSICKYYTHELNWKKHW